MTPRESLDEGEVAARNYALTVPKGGPVSRAGAALAARAGSSLEFRDHRAYEPGDDLRHVDWGAYARSDQLTVKLYREEVSPHLDILIDGSRSMALEGTAKRRATLALAGFFAGAAANAGFSHAGHLLAGGPRPLGDRRRRPELWEAVDFADRGEQAGALAAAAPQLRPRGVRVLISDLLWDADPAAAVRRLADRAASAVVVQLLAADDAEPPAGGHVRLIDSETDAVREVRVDATLLARYRDNLSRLRGHWHDACRAVGAVFVPLVAEELLTGWRVDALVAAGVLEVGG